MDREWLTVKEFLDRYRGKVGRNNLYDRIRDGTIPSVRLGRKILLPADVLDMVMQRS